MDLGNNFLIRISECLAVVITIQSAECTSPTVAGVSLFKFSADKYLAGYRLVTCCLGIIPCF